MDPSLIPFFRPTGIVVVGASSSEHKLGHGVARNLVQSGFAGAIHFVSQNAGTLFGRTLLTSLSQVPDPVDLAVLVVPPAATLAALSDCADRGIRAAIIITAGFREAGAPGAALEAQLTALARNRGIRLLGPNCIGIIDTHLPFDTSFLHPPMPASGGIGFVSQSGAFCAAVIDWSRAQGLGFSQVVSLGNQADITETDVLAAIAEDPNSRVVVLYMETVADGPTFIKTAQKVARQKPVLAIKVGRTEAGRRAAASHTAAMAGSDAAFEAAFEKCGILRASSTEQLFDWARALECCPLPAGDRLAVLTNAGGPGVIATDAIESLNLSLAQLSPSSREQLAGRLPPAASLANPVDMLAAASPEDYAFCLRVLLSDAATDSVLVILPPPPMFTAEDVATAIIPVITSSIKPVVVALMGSHLTQVAFDVFSSARIATYPFPERAASALAALVHRAQAQQRPAGPLSPTFTPDRTDSISPGVLLPAYGIQIAQIELAKSPQDAVALARKLGFPVALKIASPDITHKSDVGGVLLDINDEASALTGYTQVVTSAQQHRPSAVINGVHVQQQLGMGQDVILGCIRDPHFGPLMMFGSGGTETEGLRDVAFALAPLHPDEARTLMERTWAGRKLRGFRDMAAADRESVVDALVRLSWLAYDHPEIQQIEINPLRVFSAGAIALDVRLVKKTPSSADPEERMV